VQLVRYRLAASLTRNSDGQSVRERERRRDVQKKILRTLQMPRCELENHKNDLVHRVIAEVGAEPYDDHAIDSATPLQKVQNCGRHLQ
jgi:hypothetical protein